MFKTTKYKKKKIWKSYRKETQFMKFKSISSDFCRKICCLVLCFSLLYFRLILFVCNLFLFFIHIDCSHALLNLFLHNWRSFLVYCLCLLAGLHLIFEFLWVFYFIVDFAGVFDSKWAFWLDVSLNSFFLVIKPLDTGFIVDSLSPRLLSDLSSDSGSDVFFDFWLISGTVWVLVCIPFFIVVIGDSFEALHFLSEVDSEHFILFVNFWLWSGLSR